MNTATLQRTIVWLSYAAAFAPLILFRNFYFPFIVPKTVFFRSIVGLMFFLWLVVAIKKPSARPRLDSRITWAFGAFLFFVLLSGLLGLDPSMSFWGDFERMWGFVTLAHFFAFFIILSTTFEARDWLRFFQVNLAVGSLLSIYGIGQWLGLTLFEQAGADRIIATLGNASYVGGYTLLIVFLAAYLFSIRSNQEKPWYAAAGTLALVALFLSQTRGAYLGAIAGIVLVLGGIIIGATSRRARKIALGLFIGMVALGAFFWVFRASPIIAHNYYLRRFTEFDPQSTTAQTRFVGWRAGLKGFIERPLLGWGEENYIVSFNKYLPAYFHSLSPSETYFDRAHNQFIDTLVSEGIFGFASYMAIYVFAAVSVTTLWRRAAIDLTTFLFLLSVVAMYLIQDFFVFDTLGPFLVMVALLAYTEWLVRERLAQPRLKERAPAKHSIFVPAQWLVPLLALWFFVFWFVNVRAAVASNLGAWSVSFDDLNLALPNFEKAVQYDIPAIRDVRNTFADRVALLINNPKLPPNLVKTTLDSAVREVEKTLVEAPTEVFTATKAIKLLNLRFALFGGRKDIERAEELYIDTVPRSPERLELHLLGAQTRLLAVDYDGALRRLKLVQELNPRQADGFWFSGLVMLDAGKATTTALADLKKGFDLRFNATTEQLKRAIKAALEADDIAFVRDLYETYVRKTPSDAQAWATLATIYAQLGDKAHAREAALQAVKIDPVFTEEAKKFLQEL